MKKNQLFKIIFTLGAATFFIVLNSASAQSIDNIMNAATKTFSVEFSPKNPGANTIVSARIISYTFDTNRAEIAWIMNGKISGTGKTFSFTTGNLGSRTSLTVSVITEDKATLSKNYSFRAVEIDLLWETLGYAPPYYKGKILPISKSLIKITAIPQGFTEVSSQLIYEWKRDGKNVPDSSGLGKRTFSFYGMGPGGEENISILVSNNNGTATAVKQILIPIGNPKILFYEENPLEGPQYQKELGAEFNLFKTELFLRAEPFFFSKKALSSLSYSWEINNEKIPTPEKPNIMNLSTPDKTKGASSISLLIENPKNILERALRNIKIQVNLQ